MKSSASKINIVRGAAVKPHPCAPECTTDHRHNYPSSRLREVLGCWSVLASTFVGTVGHEPLLATGMLVVARGAAGLEARLAALARRCAAGVTS